MPIWAIILSLVIAAVPGLAGLGVAWFRMGVLHTEVRTNTNLTAELITTTGKLVEDVAYLKGVEQGKQQVAAQLLLDNIATIPARQRKSVVG